MKNGAEYIVTTYWGTFVLDEASYRDYLAGKLWISWTPGRKAQPKPNASDCLPPDVSDRAIALRDRADRNGLLATLHQLGIHKAIVPYSSRFEDMSIDEMNLTVRSSNGLKRANVGTFGRLMDLMMTESGIMSVRNLGQKSAKEIKQVFFGECYSRLLPYEKAQYWQNVLDEGEKTESPNASDRIPMRLGGVFTFYVPKRFRCKTLRIDSTHCWQYNLDNTGCVRIMTSGGVI